MLQNLSSAPAAWRTHRCNAHGTRQCRITTLSFVCDAAGGPCWGEPAGPLAAAAAQAHPFHPHCTSVSQYAWHGRRVLRSFACRNLGSYAHTWGWHGVDDAACPLHLCLAFHFFRRVRPPAEVTPACAETAGCWLRVSWPRPAAACDHLPLPPMATHGALLPAPASLGGAVGSTVAIHGTSHVAMHTCWARECANQAKLNASCARELDSLSSSGADNMPKHAPGVMPLGSTASSFLGVAVASGAACSSQRALEAG